MNRDIAYIINKMINYFGPDIKRINHALKVFSISKTIGELEGLKSEEQYILEVASVLHDIGIKISEKKYNSSAGVYQEREGPKVVLEILEDININDNALERICFLIGNHHSYNKVDGKDFRILIEADFLVNAFEDQLDINNIESVKNKIFKTDTGIQFLKTIYNIK